jgi:hypothetical protein
MIEPIGCSVLDARSRGMTVVVEFRYFTVIASEAKQSISLHEERMIFPRKSGQGSSRF